MGSVWWRRCVVRDIRFTRPTRRSVKVTPYPYHTLYPHPLIVRVRDT